MIAKMSSRWMNPLNVYDVTIPSAHITIRISAMVHNTVSTPSAVPHRSSGSAGVVGSPHEPLESPGKSTPITTPVAGPWRAAT